MLILKGRRFRVEELAFSPDGRFLAADGGGGLHIWDLTEPGRKPEALLLRPHRHPTNCGLTFLTDGRLFFHQWDRWHLFDPRTRERTDFEVEHTDRGQFAIDPAGTRIIRWYYWSDTYCLSSWQITADGTRSPAWTAPDPGVYYAAVAFSPDGTRFASAGRPSNWNERKPTLVVRAAESGKSTQVLRRGYLHPAQLLFAPDGGRLLVRSGKGVAVYDLADPGRPPVKFANRDPSHFTGMAFHPSGRYLGTVSSDRVVRVWDAAAWTEARAFTWDIGKLYAVAFSPDGTRAAVGSGTGRVLVWDFDG